ncbi:hypothetical protein CDV53_06005 [Haematobacter missouriensis]|uniref:Uncharacterized protein n=1 Tax=Haematobacter missouriensis TaxID=366616 RepID=A0ABX3ZVN8_9RHOB|nr:hypothetical protein CDV53_06005 [Haematobacter missouriensis]
MVLLARDAQIALTPAAHGGFVTDELPCQVRPNADGRLMDECPRKLEQRIRQTSCVMSDRLPEKLQGEFWPVGPA